MFEMIQILGLPFLACIMSGGILSYLGIHILRREVVFIDIALAQIAALGAIAAHIVFEVHGASVTGYLCSVGCVLLAAGGYAIVRSRVFEISLEVVIGISYAVAAAASLFLVGVAGPGGHIHVQEMLAGSLLWTTGGDLVRALAVFAVAGLALSCLRKPFHRISQDYEGALAGGTSVVKWDFLFYSLVGLVVSAAVKMAGVVAVFAMLIIPATISLLCSGRWTICVLTAWAATVVASAGGLLFAYYLDFSVGPAVVLFLGIELAAVSLCRQGVGRLVKCSP